MRETGENIRGESVCHRKELISIYVIPSKNISLPKAVKKCEVCFKLTIKKSEWLRCDIFNVNFAHILQLILVFLFLTSDW